MRTDVDVLEALADARASGCIPFVVVLPVTRELLLDLDPNIDAAALLGGLADKAIAKQVREWQEENAKL